MKKHVYLFPGLFLILNLSLFSQTKGDLPNKETEKSDTRKIFREFDHVPVMITNINIMGIGRTPTEKALNYIKSEWKEFGFSNTPEHHLKHYKTREMQSGNVVRFRQFHQGLRVDKNEITIKINRRNYIRTLLNSTFPFDANLNIKPLISEEEAFKIVTKRLGISGKYGYKKTELMIHIFNYQPRLCWQINVIPEYPFGDWEAFVDARTGTLLEVEDIAHYCGSAGIDKKNEPKKIKLNEYFPVNEALNFDNCREDAMIMDGLGKVFLPNPTYSAKTPYGTGNFVDNDDAANSDLTAELLDVTLPDIEVNNFEFTLRGPWAEIVDHGEPFQGLFTQNSADFNYDRDNPAFEAVQCYYHIDESMRYVNNELNISVEPAEYSGGVRFDPHGLGIQIQASFLPDDGVLVFGDGGFLNTPTVDFGEDKWLILHELNHGLHHWLTDQNESKYQGLSEGLSDYWGQSNSRDCSLTTSWDEWQTEYHQAFHWAGMPVAMDEVNQRSTDFTEIYNPTEITFSHEYGQHISTPLMRIYSDLGKFKTDQLVIESMSMLEKNLDNNFTLQQAAAIVYNKAIDLNYSDNDLE